MNKTALDELRQEILKNIEAKEQDVVDFEKRVKDLSAKPLDPLGNVNMNDNILRAYCQSVVSAWLSDIGVNKRMLRLIDALYYEDERKDFQ